MSEVPSEKVQAKAGEYLLSGRVKVQFLANEERVDFLANVTPKAGGDPYRVKYTHGVWNCDCPARVEVCAHVLACQTITNFKKLTAPTEVEFSHNPDIDKLLGL